MDTNKPEIQDVEKQEKYVVCSLCGKLVSSNFYMNYNPDDKYVLCPNCRVKLMQNQLYNGKKKQSGIPVYVALLCIMFFLIGIVRIASNSQSVIKDKQKQENLSQRGVVGYWEDPDFPTLVYRIREVPGMGYVLELGNKKTMSDWSEKPNPLDEQYISGWRVFFNLDKKISDRHIFGSVLGEEGYYDGDYFIIDTYGDLKCFDWHGYVTTLKRM